MAERPSRRRGLASPRTETSCVSRLAIVATRSVAGYQTPVLIDGAGLEVARREGVLQGATGPFLSKVRAALRDRG